MPTSVTTPITNSAESVYNYTAAGLSAFFAFIPSLIGAIIVLIIGWFIAKGIAALVNKLLRVVGFERAMEHSGVDRFVEATGTRWDTTKAIAELSRWFIFLIFVQAAANVLNMPQITTIINSIILYIPNVIVAIVIMVAGIMLARFIAGIVRGSLSELQVRDPNFLAMLSQYVLIAFAAIAALDQLGIARVVVNSLLIGLVGALSLGFGLAFGLGGRDVAARITQSWYEHGLSMSGRLQQRSFMQQNQPQDPTTYMGPPPSSQTYPGSTLPPPESTGLGGPGTPPGPRTGKGPLT